MVAQARALLVARHPSGERVETVPVRGSRRERIEALLAILGDPSTRLLPAKAWAPFLAEVSGQRTTGVGLRELLDLDLSADGRLVVITSQPGGPAARAGIAPPDALERIDGKVPRDLTDAMARLRGAAGTEVVLALRRGDEERSPRLRRIALPAAGDHVRAATLDGGLLWLAIDGFSAATPRAVERALEGGGCGRRRARPSQQSGWRGGCRPGGGRPSGPRVEATTGEQSPLDLLGRAPHPECRPHRAKGLPCRPHRHMNTH